MKKFVLRIVAWLMAVAMMIPSAGVAISAQAAQNYKGSVTFKADGEWVEQELSIDQLIANVKPEDVTAIKFTSDTNFAAGYNDANHAWKWSDMAKTYTAKDIALDGWFAFKFAFNVNDGKNHTINWEVLTGDGEDSQSGQNKNGEEFAVETIINESWGVYTNKIPVSTLQKYKDGMVLDIDFKVDSGAGYALMSPVNAIEGWPKLVEYITGVDFNSDDGSYIAFGPDAKNVKMTINKKGMERLIADGGGLIIQAYQLQFTGITLSSTKPKATPKPTATPAPTATPTPIPEYTTYGDELVVDADMVKNGAVVVENASYNSIIIPRGIEADSVELKNVKVENLEVESGADYAVNLYSGKIGSMNITAPEISGVSRPALLKLLDEKVTLTDEIILNFVAYNDTVKAIAERRPTINVMDKTVIGEFGVGGNVRLSANGCTVKSVKVDTKNAVDAMNVELRGYSGSVDVAISNDDKSYCMAKLNLNGSDVDTVNVTGANGSFYIYGNSNVDKVQMSNVDVVTIGVDAKELSVDEKTEDAKIRVCGTVNTVNVAGKKNDIVLASAAEILNSNVTGDGVRMYGYGTLENVEVTGEDAIVAVYGASVNGDYERTIPNEMKAMNPANILKPSGPRQIPEKDENGGEDLEYAGDWASGWLISADELAAVDGDVTLEISYKVIKEGYEYNQFAFEDKNNSEHKLANEDFTFLAGDINDWGYLTVSRDSDSVAVTLKGDVAHALSNGISLTVYGVIITDVVVSDTDLNADPDAAYTGDWSKAYTIEADEFEGFVDKVTMTIKCRLLSTVSSGNFAFFQELDGWEMLTSSAFDNLGYDFSDEWKNMTISEINNGTVTITLTKETVEEIISNGKGLGVQVFKIIVEDVTLSGEKEVVNGGGGSNGLLNATLFDGTFTSTGWGDSEQLSADKFTELKFNGTEKLVITYTATADTQLKLANMGDGWSDIVIVDLPATASEKTKEFVFTEDWEPMVVGGIALQGPGNFTVKKVQLIGIEGTQIYSGSTEVTGWGSGNIFIAAAQFSDLEFDGSEKLLITYCSTDMEEGYTAMQLCDSSWGTIGQLDPAMTAMKSVVELELTSDYAVAANGGMYIQGFNWIITSILLVEE